MASNRQRREKAAAPNYLAQLTSGDTEREYEIDDSDDDPSEDGFGQTSKKKPVTQATLNKHADSKKPDDKTHSVPAKPSSAKHGCRIPDAASGFHAAFFLLKQKPTAAQANNLASGLKTTVDVDLKAASTAASQMSARRSAASASATTEKPNSEAENVTIPDAGKKSTGAAKSSRAGDDDDDEDEIVISKSRSKRKGSDDDDFVPEDDVKKAPASKAGGKRASRAAGGDDDDDDDDAEIDDEESDDEEDEDDDGCGKRGKSSKAKPGAGGKKAAAAKAPAKGKAAAKGKGKAAPAVALGGKRGAASAVKKSSTSTPASKSGGGISKLAHVTSVPRMGLSRAARPPEQLHSKLH